MVGTEPQAAQALVLWYYITYPGYQRPGRDWDRGERKEGAYGHTSRLSHFYEFRFMSSESELGIALVDKDYVKGTAT